MDAAHRRQIVHRDLKPGNVLLKSREGATAKGGLADSYELKIADFGLAKQLDALDDQTGSFAMMGTPRYMSPEQAAGGSRYVGPAADVHALGAILYELLAGRPAFDGASTLEVLEKVRRDEPLSLRSLNAAVPRDLEVIVLKCLRKEPHERYGSAAELADDLHRYATGEPILARPAGLVERLVKWTIREPALAITYALTVLVVALVSVASGAVWLWQDAEAQRVLAVGAKGEAETARDLLNTANINLKTANSKLDGTLKEVADLREAEARRAYSDQIRNVHQDILHNRELERARDNLMQCAERFRGWEWDFLELQTRTSHRSINAHGGFLVHVAVNRDGSRIASLAYGQPLKLWDGKTSAMVRSWPLPPEGVFTCAAFHPSEDLLAISSAVKLQKKGAGSLQIWNAKTDETKEVPMDSSFLVELMMFSPDGRVLACLGPRRHVYILDWKSGKLEYDWELKSDATGLEFTPDSKELAVVTQRAGVQRLDLKTWKESAWASRQMLIGFAINPRTLKPTSRNAQGQFIDWTDPENEIAPSGKLLVNEKFSRNLAYHPDGRWLAAAIGKNVILREPATGRVFTVEGHSATVTVVEFSADGRWLVSGSEEGVIRIWDVRGLPYQRQPVEIVVGSSHPTRPIFNADGTQVAYLTGGALTRFSAVLGDRAGKVQRKFALGLEREAKCFTPDLQWIAAAKNRDRMVLISVKDEAVEREFATPPKSHTIKQARASGDGRWLAAWGDNRLTFWNFATGAVAASLDNVPIAPGSIIDPAGDLWFRPDGNACVVFEGTELVSRSVPDGAVLRRIPAGGPFVRLGFSDDSKSFAISSVEKTIRIYDFDTGKVRQILEGHAGSVLHVAFQPGGRRLASASSDKTIRIWDLKSGKDVLILSFAEANITHLDFGGPTGNRLAWVRGANLEVADVNPPPTAAPEIAIPEPKVDPKTPKTVDQPRPFTITTPFGIGPIGFSADGKKLITCQGAVSIKVWDLGTQKLLEQLKAQGGTTHLFDDGKGLTRLTWNIDKKQVAQRFDLAGKLQGEILTDESLLVKSAISRDGALLAIGNPRNGKIDIRSFDDKDFWTKIDL